ncbi:MAG TPA: hypothetical protein DCS93_27895 [Microscillaceae bacterium]|nr:hypothetical protein [Microscillaceae bacterium]
MDFNILNVLLLFGLLQCSIMVGLIVHQRKWQLIQNRLLLALLGVLALSLVPSFIGNTGLIFRYPFFRFIPLHLAIFVFPLLYLYIRSLLASSYKFNLPQAAHLVVPGVFWSYELVIWIVTLFYAVKTKGKVAQSLGYFEIQSLQYLALFLMLLYYAYTIFWLLKNTTTSSLTKQQLRYLPWIKKLMILLLVGSLLEFTSIILGKIYGYWRGSPVDEWLGFSFTLMVKAYNAIVVYTLSLMGYLSYANWSSKRNSKPVDFSQKYIHLIQTAMEEDKLYLKPGFSLQALAEVCQTSTVNISHILNNHLHTSFNDLVNKYRVEEVKGRLKTPQAQQLTLFAIAQEAGFTSKTTFYRAFKKITQQTPNAYLKSIQVPK